MWLSRVVAIATVMASLPGCTVVLNHTIDKAPNRYLFYRTYFNITERHVRPGDVDHELIVPVGPPLTHIWLGVIEPKTCQRPKGTIFVLHGVFSATSRSPANSMLATGESLSLAGFRAVLMDLRGHGRSGGRLTTAGALECRDLVQVINALQQQGVACDPIGVVGYSLGAGTAILAASRDPRIQTVVAVAPPISMRESIPHFAWTAIPITRYLFSHEDFQSAINGSALRNGFHPEEASVITAIALTCAPILLIHATDDAIAPIQYGIRLQSASNGTAQLLVVPGEDISPHVSGHTRLLRDDSHQVKEVIVEWLNRLES